MISFSKRPVWYFALVLLAASCATTAPGKKEDLVWPLPPELPRIKYLDSYCCSDHFGQSGSVLMQTLFGTSGKLQMSKPYGVATDNEGKIYVTDTGLGTVWVFDAKAKKVSFLGTGGLRTPVGVAIDAKGQVFVSDARAQRVYAYNKEGKQIMNIGHSQGELANPSGLAIDPTTNRLYVANAKLHLIKVYDTNTGKFLFDIGARGSDDGRLNFPTNLSIKNGKLYVTDTGNFRVQIFDLDGKFLKNFGRVGDNLGQFARPKGVDADSEGHIYVTDAAFDNFQIFNEDGQLLLFVGNKGRDLGQFWLPSGLHIDGKDRIYVADQYNNRVQVFQYLTEKAAAALAKTP